MLLRLMTPETTLNDKGGIVLFLYHPREPSFFQCAAHIRLNKDNISQDVQVLLGCKKASRRGLDLDDISDSSEVSLPCHVLPRQGLDEANSLQSNRKFLALLIATYHGLATSYSLL